ncbi:hypothetical protein PHJA_000364800 [Phtheirospermum japonicum]|uniref:Protein SHORTAGE IN CHIASMATA 1 n=1 Tax=Phtheirospermum japonicum TaxID=374723 RepID=A0A830B5L0_9LAMI|nr:hypothetical protein PHJA_000364800 [Phtheirospermum japonicum]
MRTRFLATDYSTTAAVGGGAGVPVEILNFAPLHPPHFSPSIDTKISAKFSQSLDEIPVFDVASEIEKLPIDDALSIFMSDVLPHFFDGVDFEEPRIESSNEKSDVLPTEEKDGTTSNNKGEDRLKFMQFEIPEMDVTLLPSKNSADHSQIECSLIFSEITDAEFTKDSLHSELTLHNPSEVLQSVYSVDDLSVEYSIDQKSNLSADADYAQGELQSHNIKFPLFEVDVESLDILGRIHKMGELLSFENTEKQQVAHPDEEYSTLHGKPDGDLIWSMDPVLFDVFLFIDLDAYYFCEVFSDSAKEIETETCESLFGEAMNFRSFSQLIVCHELTLMDDYFKSLPVPIFSDHENTCSSHALVEELLAQLDWQSSSASDGLYLDWQFLGEDDCGSGKYSSCLKIVCEVDTYNIDAAMYSSDSGKQIFDFLLSDCHSDKPNAENDKEILNLSCSDVSMLHPSGKAGLSTLMNHEEGRKINEDILLRAGVEKVPKFGESMSSDLEFFLNPRSHMKERECTPTDKSVDTGTVCQVLESTDDSAAANITSEDQQKWNVKMHQKSDLDSASTQNECETKLEELLNTVPVKEIYDNEPVETVNEDDCCNMMPDQSMSVGFESKQNLSCKPLCPRTIIIVNTRNFNEEMVISRRSTYQRILNMEQEGSQVVERDIGLPVDVILSSEVCLTWYDCRNIGRKASAPDEAFSCLPLCVESIAASILTSLSFAFSCCILIFEGDSNFLCSIMESSDELYAAAASLGIDIQLFCSYSYEMTEEIILACINVAAESNRELYPRMSDAESLAESFLTAIPSINPLSAHAILSSDVILGKFLELSNVDRISALQKYKVPDESVALLSVLSRYGEQEDPKSGLTNCSSSVSVPESENVEFKIASERKKPKYTHNLYDAGEPPNDLFHMESLKPLPDDQLNLPNFSASCNSWLSGSTEIYNKSEQIDLSFDDKLLGRCPDIDVDMMKESVNKSSLHDFPATTGFQISDERDKPWMPQIDVDCSPRWRSATTSNKSFSTRSTKVTGILQENFTGEVVDVDDTPASMEKFSSGNFSSFSPFVIDVEKDYAAKSSRMTKRPFSATNLPPFTNPTDNDSAPGAWVSRDKAQISRKEIKPHFDTINRNTISSKKQNGLVSENMIEKALQNPHKLSFQGKDTRSFGGTPLSNALHSTQPQGSPWTIEFLNRIREKSRLRKQSVSVDLSSPVCFGSSGNTSKCTKRKSPSILEFYKYQGGSTPQKKVEQKISSQPLNSLKNKSASASRSPLWTPVDKRARRALSFSTNGSGGQTQVISVLTTSAAIDHS